MALGRHLFRRGESKRTATQTLSSSEEAERPFFSFLYSLSSQTLLSSKISSGSRSRSIESRRLFFVRSFSLSLPLASFGHPPSLFLSSCFSPLSVNLSISLAHHSLLPYLVVLSLLVEHPSSFLSHRIASARYLSIFSLVLWFPPCEIEARRTPASLVKKELDIEERLMSERGPKSQN